MAASSYSLRLEYVPAGSVIGPDDDPPLDDPTGPDDPRPEELNGDWLRLEQTPFDEPPAGGFAQWMMDNDRDLTLASLTEFQEKYASVCSEDGSLQVGIEVHKSRAALAYKLIASYGTLSPASVAESDRVESHSLEAGDEIDLQSRLSGDAQVTWEGPVYDENGVQLDQPPDVTQEGGKLTMSQNVTGTLRTSYTEVYDKYTLTIMPRPAADTDPSDKGSAYQSTVMAFWGNGHVERMDVSLPSMIGNCGAGLDSDDDEDDGDDYDGECYDLYVKYHKCTGEEISRELKRVKCPEQVAAECEQRCNDGPESERDACLQSCRQ